MPSAARWVARRKLVPRHCGGSARPAGRRCRCGRAATGPCRGRPGRAGCACWSPWPSPRSGVRTCRGRRRHRRMSLARLSSAFSRFSALSWADSSVVVPGLTPASTSFWRTHLDRLSAPTPSLAPFSLRTRSCTGRGSRRTARSRTSVGYGFGMTDSILPRDRVSVKTRSDSTH